MPTLDFKGKQIVYAHHLTVPSRTLEIDARKSFAPKGNLPPPPPPPPPPPDFGDNLIIHGDNLHALKALMPRYAGRVNCIYIDPPYNTGNEKWVYNDNVNSPMMKEWLKDKNSVDGEDLERHDKWLCMMWPRLHLLRELLAEDGVIFVSIDDNEQHRLRMVMDEIFGDENFVGSITVKGNPRGRDYGGIARMHDYLLVYQHSSKCELNWLEDQDKEFPYKDKFGDFEIRELRNRNIAFHKGNRPNLYYPFYLNLNQKDESGFFQISLDKKPKWIEVLPKKSQGIQTVWRWGKEKSRANLNTEIVGKLTQNNDYQIVEKYREKSQMARSIWFDKEVNTERGTLALKTIFNKKVFGFPKPYELIRRVVEMGANPNALILDSFAGSGTTAHAVLELNKEDNGNRKFILVECEDYANKITAERVRRVIKGIPKSKDENLKKGLGGSFTYCTLGDEIGVEKMLTGKKLPDYETLARYVAYTATGQSPDKIRKARGKDGFFYETKDRLFYLIYEPKLAFLRSAESALNSERAERIAAQVKTKKKTAIVFATHKFMGQKELTKVGITFAQLPYSVSS